MYSIISTKKINSRASATKAAKHNFRKSYQNNICAERINSNVPMFNQLGVDRDRPSSLQEKISKKYKDLGVKEKTNNVFMVEFVLTASPEYFFEGLPGWSRSMWDKLYMTKKEHQPIIEHYWKQVDRSKIDAWAAHQMEFMKHEFGDSFELMDLHLDEKTPHAHAIISIAKKSVKKYKNRYGTCERETWSLDAKKYDRTYLIGLHTRYADWNKKLGLKRGKYASEAFNTTLKEYYKKSASEVLQMLDELTELREVEAQVKERLPKIIEKQQRYSESINILLDILSTKKLSPEEFGILEKIAGEAPKVQKSTAKNPKT